MNVIIEFLDDEPIENVITCLNYSFDKVIFFGYSEIIEKRHESMEQFLKRRCDVKRVLFYPVSHTDLSSVVELMRENIEKELEQSHQGFFDITGGENLVLVAFGILSGEMKLPMHMYDVESGKLIELNRDAVLPISRVLEQKPVEFNLDRHIELQGGIVNYRMNKTLKNIRDEEFDLLLPRLWEVSQKHADVWNVFSDFLKQNSEDSTEEGDEQDDLAVDLPAKQVLAYVRKSRALDTLQELEHILDDCAAAGILENVFYDDEKYSFRYHSSMIKDCLWDAGSILELHTYQQEKIGADDCRVGIHLDWDGVINGRDGNDVLNEIDVLSLHGYVPTFISCKNGHVDKEALYELDAVTKKFGGKYAKKALAATRKLSGTDLRRAQEMNIEVL